MSKEKTKKEDSSKSEKAERISISLKPSLIERAKKEAEKQNRTLSNYFAYLVIENTKG